MKTCVSKILKESTRRRLEQQALGNLKRLECQAVGDQLLQKIFEVKRKFIFILTEKVHQEVRESCKEFQAAEQGRARIYNQVLDNIFVQDLVNILPTS